MQLIVISFLLSSAFDHKKNEKTKYSLGPKTLSYYEWLSIILNC